MDFTKSPYGLPESSPNARKVNRILEESYKLQQKIGLMNACAFVNIILQQVLAAIGIESEVKHGCIKRSDSRLQHIWLTINGYIVDNAILAASEKFKPRLVYEDVVPSDSTENLIQENEYTRKMGLKKSHLTPKVFTWMLENREKYIAMCQNKGNIMGYVHKFAEFLDKEYSVKDFPANYANEVCWNCGDDAVTLKQCKKCKVAKYCNTACQKRDWKTIHKDVCISPETH